MNFHLKYTVESILDKNCEIFLAMKKDNCSYSLSVPFRSPGKIWDFLQDTIPEFKHQDESLPLMKPQISHPAARRDSNPRATENLLQEQNNTKGSHKESSVSEITCLHRLLSFLSLFL